MDFSFQGKYPPSELAAMVSQSTVLYEEDEWLADSGANNHIIADLSNLTLQQTYQGTKTVAIGNGNGLQIQNTSSSSFQTPNSNSIVHLNNILHCPEVSPNLLSINKFCKDNNCHFKFTDTYFLVKDNQTGEILLQGLSKDGLYPMQLKKFSRNKARRYVILIGIKTTVDVWHSRLGHPNHQVLQFMLKHQQIPVLKSKSNKLLCIPCQLAKSRKLPFCDSSRVTSAPLELIHSDVWTSPVLSTNGYKFYIIFVDDFSCYTWLVPLKHKFDALEQFVKFKCLTENLFSQKIKQFQTDGGGEYTSSTFSKFLADHGIFHRITCPHTSQQNGIAEMKHRHIIETGLSLLAQSHLPPKFWVNAFHTTVYLINRMPTNTLHHSSPFPFSSILIRNQLFHT
jgi:hypothetical protein